MRTVLFIPALRQLSGGLANIYSLAENLAATGREVALMGPDPDAAGFAQAAARGLPVLPWGTKLSSADLWCIPESWPNAMSVGLESGARVVVYVQNWALMLGVLPQGISWKILPLEYVAVSHPVEWFLRNTLCLGERILPGGVLPPVVPDIFFTEGAQAGGRVRIAFMPRKNRPLAEQIRFVAEARLAEMQNAPKVEWVSIHKQPREEVATLLAGCHLFMSTGFPEGFGLPPLEAMASGCVPVGFTGFGGWEYMRQARAGELYSPYAPPFVLPPLPAGESGNGFFFSDGDTLGAGMALAGAALFAAGDSAEWQGIRKACRQTAAAYGAGAQAAAAQALFPA